MTASVADGPFRVLVDPTHRPYQALKRGFDEVDPEYEHARFSPIPVCAKTVAPKGPVEFSYADLPVEGISPGQLLAHLQASALQPAVDTELVSFGRAYPNEQREATILALGSIATLKGGFEIAACLDSRNGRRRLTTYWLNHTVPLLEPEERGKIRILVRPQL